MLAVVHTAEGWRAVAAPDVRMEGGEGAPTLRQECGGGALLHPPQHTAAASTDSPMEIDQGQFV